MGYMKGKREQSVGVGKSRVRAWHRQGVERIDSGTEAEQIARR